ncbi:MAG: hypothetical protein ABR501_07395 [Pyrinomonadaceae bacterium]
MSELDQAWAVALAKAELRAREAGRTDISEYLALRTDNDLVRTIGSEWLFTMFESVVGERNRHDAGIHVSTDDPHRFRIGTSEMVGRRLTFQKGVRKLYVEIGWPRTPRDGFIRGGGLARASIKHTGIKSANEELRLMINEAGTPAWVLQRKHGSHTEMNEEDVRHHIGVLLNDPQISSRHS